MRTGVACDKLNAMDTCVLNGLGQANAEPTSRLRGGRHSCHQPFRSHADSVDVVIKTAVVRPLPDTGSIGPLGVDVEPGTIIPPADDCPVRAVGRLKVRFLRGAPTSRPAITQV